jgi:hypothetical protein
MIDKIFSMLCHDNTMACKRALELWWRIPWNPEPGDFNGSIKPIYIPKLRNFLTIGTFVNKIKDSLSVWLIVDALVNDCDFRANQFAVVNFNVNRFERESHRYVPHRGSITHECAGYVPELVKRSNCEQFPPASVEDAALFVYKLSERWVHPVVPRNDKCIF